eukprot:TRINITY_DN4392_c0_g2_i2.p1 TRINITY_DN4392_c0_g2~~TRINITY_DN4392_c0_g2_i2.p1  ORF type:complete len:487 (+),score=83.02 TRINITY_DN4392_c0_g2_i2:187-1647(+)
MDDPERLQKSLQNFDDLIQQNRRTIQKVNGLNLTLVLGSTGAGKTTTINALCGCKMQKEKLYSDGVHYRHVINASDSGNGFKPLKIGNGDVSETLIASVVEDPESKEYFVDFPGFFDNRGWEVALANSTNIFNIINECKGVKFMIVIPASAAETDRGASIRSMLRLLDFSLSRSGGVRRFVNNVIIVVTKAKSLQDVWRVERVVRETDSLLQVVGVSYEDESNPKFAEDPGDEDAHLGTVQSLKKQLLEKVGFVEIGQVQLSLAVTDEEKYILAELQQVANQQVKQLGLDRISESAKLFRSLFSLRISPCQQVQDLLKTIARSYLSLFEEGKTKMNNLLLTTDVLGALEVQQKLIQSRKRLQGSSKELGACLESSQVLQQCQEIMDKQVVQLRKVRIQKREKEEAEKRSQEAQELRRIVEEQLRQERLARLETQRCIHAEQKKLDELERQAELDFELEMESLRNQIEYQRNRTREIEYQIERMRLE